MPPWKPPTSAPTKGWPDTPIPAPIGIPTHRWSQRDWLSPIQFAACRWMPAEPARDRMKVRSSGMACSRPSCVAIAISRAYWLWNRSCEAVPRSNSIRCGGMLPVAGSFMSFQMPASPDATCSALRRPHHPRASWVTKSGKTVSPGHT